MIYELKIKNDDGKEILFLEGNWLLFDEPNEITYQIFRWMKIPLNQQKYEKLVEFWNDEIVQDLIKKGKYGELEKILETKEFPNGAPKK